MGTFIERAGQRFGRLVVLSRHFDSSRRTKWLCRCDCGREKIIGAENLASGHTASCGCAWIEAVSRPATHGMSQKKTRRLYQLWHHMMSRCYDQANLHYGNYGGRGIAVCQRWHSVEHFVADVGQPPTPTHTMDRIDNNGDYAPSNFRWATRRQQIENTRRTINVTYRGETMSLMRWSERINIHYATLLNRLRRSKMSPEEAFTRPLQHGPKLLRRSSKQNRSSLFPNTSSGSPPPR